MTVAAFTGQSLSAGSGMLDEGKTMSPVQLLLDREFAAGSAHLAREFDATPENLAIDDIVEVDIGIHESHLGTMRTAQRFRDVHAAQHERAVLGTQPWCPPPRLRGDLA